MPSLLRERREQIGEFPMHCRRNVMVADEEDPVMFQSVQQGVPVDAGRLAHIIDAAGVRKRVLYGRFRPAAPREEE